MKKQDQNPQFELWLAAYGQRLIEVAGTCISAQDTRTPENSQSSGQSDSAQQAAPKQD